MLGRGLETARPVPGVDALKRSLAEQLVAARRGEKAAAIHELAEVIRFRYGVDPPAAR